MDTAACIHPNGGKIIPAALKLSSGGKKLRISTSGIEPSDMAISMGYNVSHILTAAVLIFFIIIRSVRGVAKRTERAIGQKRERSYAKHPHRRFQRTLLIT